MGHLQHRVTGSNRVLEVTHTHLLNLVVNDIHNSCIKLCFWNNTRSWDHDILFEIEIVMIISVWGRQVSHIVILKAPKLSLSPTSCCGRRYVECIPI